MLFMRTYCLKTVLVDTHFHVKILQIFIRSLLSRPTRLFVHAGPPRSIHLLVLLLRLRILIEVVRGPLLLLRHLLHLHVLRVALDRSWLPLVLVHLSVLLGLQLLLSLLLLVLILALGIVVLLIILILTSPSVFVSHCKTKSKNLI